jgi:hypothetical protein
MNPDPSDGTYIDEKLRETQSDLLYEIQIGRHRAVIYVLLEHKSECDPLTVVQLFVYVGQILKKYAEEGGGQELRLPVVVPMILHHSTTGWTAATELAALYGEVLEEVPGLKEHAANLRCSLLDVSHLSDEELKAMALGAVMSLTLWALRDARSPARLLRAFGFWAETIVELEKAPDGRRALEVLFRYISMVSEISREELAEALAEAAPEAKEIIMTLAEQLRQEGLNDGIQKGRIEGAAGVLRRQLELRFGVLSEDVSARLQAATQEEIDKWSERFVTADSLAAVFAD